MDNIELEFDTKVLDYIVDKAIEFKFGARGLRSICETIMVDAMFDFNTKSENSLNITLRYAREKIERESYISRLKAV